MPKPIPAQSELLYVRIYSSMPCGGSRRATLEEGALEGTPRDQLNELGIHL